MRLIAVGGIQCDYEVTCTDKVGGWITSMPNHQVELRPIVWVTNQSICTTTLDDSVTSQDRIEGHGTNRLISITTRNGLI